jgi:hypothetical protein
MARVGNLILVTVTALLSVWISFSEVGAQYKEFKFNKDIQVVPDNAKPGTKIDIKLSVDKTRINPGDTVTVFFEPDKDCYLTLVDVGTSGKITQLWPNQFSGGDNLVRAHQRNSFPGPSDKFRFRASGPEGIERIVALAASEKNAIVPENEFGNYANGFKPYQKEFKDLVVETAGRTESLPEHVKWGTAEVKLVIGNVPTGGRITSRNVYMLSVGSTTLRLKYCDDDARGFANLMRDKLQIPAENVRLLVGNQGTKAGMVQGLRWLAEKTQPEDLVIVYFSGHGTRIRDQPPARHPDGISAALICYHNKPRLTVDDPDLKRILLVDYDFGRLLKKIPARRRLIVVDSCHSGSITKEIQGAMVSKYIPLLTPEEIQQIRAERFKELHVVDTGVSSGQFGVDASEKESLLAACAKNESSIEDGSKRAGLFTYWLATNIRKDASDLNSAFERARQNVVEETKSRPDPQTPQITDEYALARDIKF